jgi:cytochrome c oxidase subunit II
MKQSRYLVLASLGQALFFIGCNAPMDTLRPESDFAQWITSIYWETIGWYSLILILVVSLIVLVLAKHSTRRTVIHQKPVHVNEHLVLEAAWTVGPALILLLVAFPAIVINFMSQPNEPPRDALHVQVIAHQWWWEFHYPKLGIVTANEVHIPVNRRVWFQLNSADIIHSFWVPRLGGKRDVIPNHTNELILTPRTVGEYYGQCAEFCGLSHANMRMRVFVDTAEQFAKWTADQTSRSRDPVPDAPNYAQVRAGMELFEGSPCTTCHKIKGISKGTLAPDLTHFASRTTLAGATLENTPAQVAAWIENPDEAKPGAKMPAMALSPVQLSAMVAYLESLR